MIQKVRLNKALFKEVCLLKYTKKELIEIIFELRRIIDTETKIECDYP